MSGSDELRREIESLRERLSKLSETSLRVTEELDLDTVLQEIVDGARFLTGASRAFLVLIDESGRFEAFLTSGVTDEEHRTLVSLPGGIDVFHHLISVSEPVRVADFSAWLASFGLPVVGPPLGPVKGFLGAPIRHRGTHFGIVNVSGKGGGLEFTDEDEDTLQMFTSQAAMAIANARRYREEQRARAHMETLVDTSPVGVVVFDAVTGAPVSLNMEGRRIVDGLRNPDQPAEQLLEVLTFRRADGREVSLQELPLSQALSPGKRVRAEEVVLTVPDGRRVTVLLNATPVMSDSGDLESFVVTVQDMTPLKELERLRAEFLEMVSHELRAPLTSIKGSAAAVLSTSSRLDTAGIHQFFRIVDNQADHMLDLISHLLETARIEAGTLALAPESTDVAALIDESKDAFLNEGGNHSVQVEISADLPPIMADRQRIVQVLSNLLSNAAEHSLPWSTVRVTAVRKAVHVAISVADEGKGLAPESLPHLFRKFSRFDNVSKESGTGGTGLGLAISKGIVEAHGGRIWAESEGLGRGTRITFTVPVVEDAATVAVRPSTGSGSPERQRTPILAIDGDPQTLRYVRDTLSEVGFAVIATSDPKEAAPLTEQYNPHVVLLDLMLPGADGIDLMRDIFSFGHVPIIFLSGDGQDDAIARAFEQGADDYIVKPFSPTELIARIRAALRRRGATEWAEPDEPYVLGDLTIDYARRLVTVAGRPVQLTPTEYDLLSELSVHAGRVLTHNQLLQRVWGHGTGDARVIRTHLRRLRRKLDENADSPKYIFAEPRVGYRMASSDSSRSKA